MREEGLPEKAGGIQPDTEEESPEDSSPKWEDQNTAHTKVLGQECARWGQVDSRPH